MRLTSVTSISLLAGHTLAYRGIDLHNGAALVGRDTSIPTCVSDCVQPSADAAGCNSVDYSCLCASSVFITATAKCLAATCTTSTDIETGVALGQQTCEAIGISEVIPASASSIIVAAEAGSYTAAASVTSDAAATSTASDKSQTTASGAITSASAAQASNTSTSEAATSGAESLRVPALLAFVGFVVSW